MRNRHRWVPGAGVRRILRRADAVRNMSATALITQDEIVARYSRSFLFQADHTIRIANGMMYG